MALKGAENIRATLFPLFFSVAVPADDPESSIALASGSPSRSMVEALHIADAATVIMNAIKTANNSRLLTTSLLLHLSKGVDQLQCRRAQNCDEQRWEQKTCQGKK